MGESCIECGAQADHHPFVGVYGDGTHGPVCAECQGDPGHRLTPQKVHYHDRKAFESRTHLHGVRQSRKPDGPPNSTRFEIEAYVPNQTVKASVIEEALDGLIAGEQGPASIESARAYRNTVLDRTRVHLLGEVVGALITAEGLRELVAAALTTSGADRIDVQVWPVYR